MDHCLTKSSQQFSEAAAPMVPPPHPMITYQSPLITLEQMTNNSFPSLTAGVHANREREWHRMFPQNLSEATSSQNNEGSGAKVGQVSSLFMSSAGRRVAMAK